MAHPFCPARREFAPMLTSTWGTRAPTLASMITHRPDLGRRLALSPAWALHATAAYVEARLVAGRDADEIAVEVESRHPRYLLGQAVPEAHERLASTRKRVAPPVRDLGFYKRLNDLLHGPAAEVLLEAAHVTAGLLNVAETIAGDPVLRAAYRALGASETDVRALGAALTYLRSMGLAKDIEALPPGSGWRAILRRCQSDLARAKAPVPPFPIPSGWRAVVTVGQLFEIGERLGNCVGGLRFGAHHHISDLITGRSFFLAHQSLPALVSVKVVGPKLWALDETSSRGPRQTFLTEKAALVAALKAAAAKAGQTLFDKCPLATLGDLSWRAGAKRAEAADHDEMDEME